ncbi:hypothetical protein SLNSH_02595 [Alsobacter soli]|uniref:Uncharacterized protein n=1 Tax=Alsobacter soli TaxID=2109933 RepID=A0A2T1HYL7_9HYPH|nr:hypothetical protein [Alsobacter soli]PSC06704.1 hypothetical protein SLNSH_02595 [Alsobacter soli]
MDFYSFSFGEVTAAQGDADQPPVLTAELNFGFRDAGAGPVQTVSLRLRQPQVAGRTPESYRREAYAAAAGLLRAAAELCEAHKVDELEARTRASTAILLDERP